MKTILVPTDFSKNSINAVEYAVALAKKEKARLILLNAYDFVPPTSDIPIPTDIIDTMRNESEIKLRVLSDEIIKRKKVKCEYFSQFNFAVPAIIETARKEKTNLIVMGTKGASGIKEVLMGSNTASVIEKATCPVIAVPESASFDGVKKITYATDYRESDIDALKKLIEIAKPFNARITILHASDEEFSRYSEETYLNDFKNKVKKKIRYDKISYKLIYGKYLPKALGEEIATSAPDLLAMSTQHRNAVEKFFGTSITKKMAFHSKIPLMAFHHKKESVVFI